MLHLHGEYMKVSQWGYITELAAILVMQAFHWHDKLMNYFCTILAIIIYLWEPIQPIISNVFENCGST